jgi:hypothetical protein
MCASSYEYVSNIAGKPRAIPAGCNNSNYCLENFRWQECVSPTSLRHYRALYRVLQKIQQTLSAESLNPPVTQMLAAHFSVGCLTHESRTLT